MKCGHWRWIVRTAPWMVGVILPLHLVVFEALTHQMSGATFDPMPTPWHALMWLMCPLGVGLSLIASKRSPLVMVGLAAASFSLPIFGLAIWALIPNLGNALLSLIAGVLILLLEPLRWGENLFGDYFGSPLKALAYLAPFTGFIVALILVGRRCRRGSQLLVVTSLLAGGGLLVLLEAESLKLERDITAACQTLKKYGDVVATPELSEDRSKEILARLSCPGQQFSSHGVFYAVGPVDVFGPSVYVRRGRPHPVEVSMANRASDFLRLFEALWPGEEPSPRTWRGLSPWEVSTP